MWATGSIKDLLLHQDWQGIDIETHTEDGKIRCKICLDHHGPDHFKEWIWRDSLKSHIRSSIHNRCLECQARLDSAIDPKDNFHKEIFVTAQAIPIDNMDGHQATQSYGRSDAEQEMWDGFVPTNNAFEIEHRPEETSQDARQEFECKINQFEVWGGLETMSDLDRDLENVKAAWDKTEHDDILNKILKNLGLSKTYWSNSNLHGRPVTALLSPSHVPVLSS